jgi:desulfoferrodoxin (superoxide reductase-like protein)
LVETKKRKSVLVVFEESLDHGTEIVVDVEFGTIPHPHG